MKLSHTQDITYDIKPQIQTCAKNKSLKKQVKFKPVNQMYIGPCTGIWTAQQCFIEPAANRSSLMLSKLAGLTDIC